MVQTQQSDRQHIFCLTRETKLKLAPFRWLDIVEKALDSPAELVKEGKTKRTVKTAISPWGEVCLHDLKYGVRKQLCSPFRPSKGKRAWKHSVSLLKNKFPITEPLLYLEVKNGPFITRTLLVTKWQKSINLGKTVLEKQFILDEFLLQLLKEATGVVARLHNAGFVHGDLKWSNFLWIPTQSDRIILADMDHIERSGSAEKQGRDLARFILSAIEFQMGNELADTMAECYFDRRKMYPIGLKKSLERHVQRKKRRYENRFLSHSAYQKIND